MNANNDSENLFENNSPLELQKLYEKIYKDKNEKYQIQKLNNILKI